MLIEYRCYEAVPGRMPDLNRRFTDLTLRMFERHGIKPVGFWTAEVGTSNQLHYLLQWDSLSDRETRWTAFLSDPEWQAGRAASEENGPLLARIRNEFWNPTAYSPML